MYKLQIKGNKF